MTVTVDMMIVGMVMVFVCRQPSLSERRLKSVLGDVCELQDNVYRCVNKTTCCKVGPRQLLVGSLIVSDDDDDDDDSDGCSSSSYVVIRRPAADCPKNVKRARLLAGHFRFRPRAPGTHYHLTLDPAVLWTLSNDTSRPTCSDSLT